MSVTHIVRVFLDLLNQAAYAELDLTIPTDSLNASESVSHTDEAR